MSLVIEILNNNDLIKISFVCAAAIVYAIAVSRLFNRIRDRRNAEEKRFTNALNNGIKKNMVTEFSDVEYIYKGVRKINNRDDEINKARLATWLRSFLLDLVENSEEETENLKSIKKYISTFIEKAESASPHAGIPDLERNIIRDIENYLNAQNTDSVKRKLNELVAAIQAREESVQKLQGITKWSVPPPFGNRAYFNCTIWYSITYLSMNTFY